MNEQFTNNQKLTAKERKHSKKHPIEIISINRPSKEDSHAKIKELSEYLSVAWVSPDNSE